MTVEKALVVLGTFVAYLPWTGAALISVGAVAGALPIFSTMIALLVAITLVVLSIVYARRATSAAPATN